MPNCELCGEPMPEGEEMFKFHGYSGDCPKPPKATSAKPVPQIAAVIEYVHRQDANGKFWLGLRIDRIEERQIGPFNTETERQRAHDDLLTMMRNLGAKDLPAHVQ